MEIIIVDHAQRCVFTTLVNPVFSNLFSRLAKKRKDRLLQELSLQNYEALSYVKVPLFGGISNSIPCTSSFIHRSYDLIYIDIIGDLNTYIS